MAALGFFYLFWNLIASKFIDWTHGRVDYLVLPSFSFYHVSFGLGLQGFYLVLPDFQSLFDLVQLEMAVLSCVTDY